MKKLPIAKTVFEKIIKEKCCYADKTRFIKMLEDNPSIYFFLSRPRRFGKSLFVDTLRAAYAGEKELFKGLYLEENWDFSKKYPIINISWGGGTIETKEEFNLTVKFILKNNAQNYDIMLEETSPIKQFQELIIKLNKKFKSEVVVLIDEYDKPILDNITNDIVSAIRDKLASFYSILKDSDKYLKFVFLTGISKFSKTSIFSKLNNITDLSLDPDYADVCGYTQIELEDIFKGYLINVDLAKVKSWYNGYNFLGNNVYNPFDILFFLQNKEYEPYWFETGTPTFLLQLIKQKKYNLPSFENIELTKSELGEFDINEIKLETLLYQTGYLTIKKSFRVGNMTIYKLAIPNKEVQIGLNDYLLRMFYALGGSPTKRTQLCITLYRSLEGKNPAILENSFKAFFDSVPHDWYRKNNIADYEGYYSSLLYAFFSALGETVIPEDSGKTEDIDLTVKTDDVIFIFEFKMKTNPNNAMKQIKEKKYYKKYINDGKDIFLIGIEFDKKEQNISNFEWEKLKAN